MQPPHTSDAPASTPFGPGNRVVSAVSRLNSTGLLSAKQALVLNRALPLASQLPEATGRKADGAHVESLGASLYTEHLVTVELAGALLFVALIGALAIAAPRPPIRPTIVETSGNAKTPAEAQVA